MSAMLKRTDLAKNEPCAIWAHSTVKSINPVQNSWARHYMQHLCIKSSSCPLEWLFSFQQINYMTKLTTWCINYLVIPGLNFILPLVVVGIECIMLAIKHSLGLTNQWLDGTGCRHWWCIDPMVERWWEMPCDHTKIVAISQYLLTSRVNQRAILDKSHNKEPFQWL